MSGKFILLFKSEDEDDQYKPMLSSRGFQVCIISPATFEFCNHTEMLYSIRNAAEYSSAVFTSRKAVEALADVAPEDLQLLKSLLVFSVGSSTSSRLRTIGLTPLGEHTGNADRLCDFILSNYLSALSVKPVLFFCSDIARGTVNDRLGKAGLVVRSIVVYTNRPNAGLRLDVTECVKSFGKPDCVAFFSPSGVSAVLDCVLQDPQLTSLTSAKILAIGPTTADYLHSQALTPHGVAIKPTPVELLNLVTKVYET